MKIAGLDIGTTGCKLTIFDDAGVFLDKAYCGYPANRGNNEHEIQAEAIMEGVFAVIKEMAVKYPDIKGIGVTSFGESFVMADEEGTPLHPALLYTDPRGAEECQELIAQLGDQEITSITGLRPHEMYSISKIMWMKRNKPDIYAKAKHIFLMEDYVVFCLTGIAQIDYSLASRTMAFDISSLKWCSQIFRCAGVNEELMSKPVPTGTTAGILRESLADRFGFSEPPSIISISHDQVAAAVGSGAFRSDVGVDGAGTVQCITAVLDGLPDLAKMYNGSYAVVPYVIPGKYVCYAFSYTGGALIQWCVDQLAKKEKEIAEERGISVNQMLEGGEDSPTGILILPHFAGAATPYMDAGSKGAIVGLTIVSTISDIYRACMEGVVYEMILNMEELEKCGVSFGMLHATGGGARSEAWMQMKADMLNMPVAALETADAGTVGSAMLTGIAVGCFSGLEDAADRMVKIKKIYRPRQDRHEKYYSVYQKYMKLYASVRPLV